MRPIPKYGIYLPIDTYLQRARHLASLGAQCSILLNPGSWLNRSIFHFHSFPPFSVISPIFIFHRRRINAVTPFYRRHIATTATLAPHTAPSTLRLRSRSRLMTPPTMSSLPPPLPVEKEQVRRAVDNRWIPAGQAYNATDDEFSATATSDAYDYDTTTNSDPSNESTAIPNPPPPSKAPTSPPPLLPTRGSLLSRLRPTRHHC